MKGKPRGSTSGLEDYHNRLRSDNTASMLKVIDRLKMDKPHSKWTYKEVWIGAGLKSKIALDSIWNSHIRAAIDIHNQRVDSLTTVNGGDILAADKPVIQALRKQVKTLREQRDQALALIAQYSADTDYYKRKSNDLQNSVDRLKSYLDVDKSVVPVI
ncbi:hypothetical protein [Pseudomonas viridiflava]|uniref:hypothetical protein n=1 Tax=Pseudomonas viridiflava TaxID=33069 RepID=UPI002E9C2D8A|nr:hypothetical protein [Pseudomonas viridiflava]